MRYLFLFILLLLFGKNYAQNKYFVKYTFVTVPNTSFPSLQTQFNNQQQVVAYINKIKPDLQSKGFIAAAVDSVLYKKDTAFAQIYTGEHYSWVNVNITTIPLSVLLRSGWDVNAKHGKLSFEKLSIVQNKLLQYYQEQGFPFAKISLDSVAIAQQQISAKLTLDTGFSYKIDSIRMFGTAKISNQFLQNYLNIKNNSLYKKSSLDNITRKINQLPYIEQQFPYSLSMLGGSAVVNLYLKPKKSSIINVLLGVIPAPNPNGLFNAPKSKLFLSGDVNILLNNALSQGETIGVNFQQLSIDSRRINLQYKHPFIFKSNYGIDGHFELYKRDSSYLNIDANFGIIYTLGENTNGKFFIQTLQSNSFPDTTVVKQTKKLPNALDVAVTNIGFQYNRNTTDNIQNPSKGNEMQITMAFGKKNITKNLAITDLKSATFNYTALYDSVLLKTYQFRLKANAMQYFSINKQTVLKLGLQAGYLQSQNYFSNELFQIGGFKTLRGFDEESQFCNQYAVTTAEWRYLIGSESFLFLFVDGAYTKNNVALPIKHTYLGTGIGLNFSTKSGIFNLSFALGNRNDIPIGFKQSKLHFGYLTIF